MIHRPNYDDVQAFLEYQREAMQHDAKTVERYWVSLRPLLLWADATPFPDIRKMRPTFPAYIMTVANQRDATKGLSPAHADRILSDSRRFLTWARTEWGARYRDLSPSWVDGMRLPRGAGADSALPQVKAWSLDDILSVCALPVSTVAERRNRAAVAFLFLSAMRAAAFLTLPIECVDIASRSVNQFPAKGVRTKNHKAAVTSLLPIPELLTIVEDWDTYVRAALPANACWFPRIDLGRADVTDEPIRTISGRRNALAQGMRLLCDRAGVPYRSPHALRHAHGVWGVSNAKTIAELKAVSQNMMHANLSLTDGVYGRLTSEIVRGTLARLGETAQPTSAPVVSDSFAETISRAVAAALQDPALRAQLAAANGAQAS